MLLHNIILSEFTPQKISRIALVLFCLVFIASCTSIDDRYHFAKRADTVKKYDRFIESYPDSKYTEDVKKRREKAKIKEDAQRVKRKKEREELKKALKDRKKWIEKNKKQLSELAKKRISSGKAIPEKPKDPGFPIVYCEIPNVSYKVFDKVLSVSVPYSIGGGFSFNIGFTPLICGNTEPGKKVMRWRKWYCNDVTRLYACVAGKWEKDEPTFSGVAGRQKETIKLRRGEPDVRYRRIELN